ncbi:hypothetical protein [Eubacterium sp. AB3007]|uniref:Nmad4 family putative nucleotide modification protein n=1 Tax=Eubacterium sp. AB3007 TaxID=1392487 RepID=UPI000486052F|nr:hypothetical protein [Eubacterium sp. AB3007]
MKMNDRARELRLPNPATPEDLEMRFSGMDGKVLTYGDKILLTGYFYQGGGKASHFGAVYEFLTEDTSCEGMIGIREISEGYFEDDGHAIAWAIGQAS